MASQCLGCVLLSSRNVVAAAVLVHAASLPCLCRVFALSVLCVCRVLLPCAAVRLYRLTVAPLPLVCRARR